MKNVFIIKQKEPLDLSWTNNFFENFVLVLESEKDEISPSVLKAHGFGNEGEKQTKTLLRFNISQDEKVRNNPKVPVFRKIS